MPTPVPQQMVTPSLRLVEPLNVGFMGSVWIAEHVSLGTRFAVKFIARAALESEPTALRRFTTEARAAARIKSPHVVQTFDHGVTERGTPYIVMELLEGETLHERLVRHGRLDPPELAPILLQLCRGLQAAHHKGVLHRDVKPENVFLCAGSEPLLVKLIDFGLAKLPREKLERLATVAGVRVGTPGFMSPELLLTQEPVDHYADLWGTAVVAYYALTGKLPFHADKIGRFIRRLERGSFTAVTKIRRELPRALDFWFARALHSDKSARFGSAALLAEAFIEALSDDLRAPATPRRSTPTLKQLRFADSSRPAAPAGSARRRSDPPSSAPRGGDPQDSVPPDWAPTDSELPSAEGRPAVAQTRDSAAAWSDSRTSADEPFEPLDTLTQLGGSSAELRTQTRSTAQTLVTATLTAAVVAALAIIAYQGLWPAPPPTAKAGWTPMARTVAAAAATGLLARDFQAKPPPPPQAAPAPTPTRATPPAASAHERPPRKQPEDFGF